MKYRYLRQFCYFHLLLYSLLTMIVSCQNKSDSHFSKSAEKALSTFELAPGFKIELVAAEPLIADPVAMEIDENGRMYVVEMHGYPLDLSGSGKIKLLTDADGDGKMDKSTVFADGLTLPTGIMRWKKGVLVTDPPNVLYLEDNDGDGQADIRNIVLTGFALSNPQHNVNSPRLGLDNWILSGP
jgi:putative membrane-bound dehydrogenase-like protein